MKLINTKRTLLLVAVIAFSLAITFDYDSNRYFKTAVSPMLDVAVEYDVELSEFNYYSSVEEYEKVMIVRIMTLQRLILEVEERMLRDLQELEDMQMQKEKEIAI